MDFLFIRSSNNEDDYVEQFLFVIVDDYSQLIHCTPCQIPTTEIVTSALLEFSSQHGLYQDPTIVSDNATYFISQALDAYCHTLGIHHRFGIAYAPFTMGTVERVNRDLLACFQTLISQLRLPLAYWPTLVPAVTGILNKLPRRQLGQRCPIGVAHNILEEDILRGLEVFKVDQTVYQVEQNLAISEFEQIANFFANWHRNRPDIKQEFRSKMFNRRFTQYINFVVGDLVLVAYPLSTTVSKIRFRWIGPAYVVELDSQIAKVRFLRNPQLQTVHVCRLAFYDHSLEGQELEVLLQYFHDTEQFEVDYFADIIQDPNTGDFLLQTYWRGFTDLEASQEPLFDMYRQLPNLVTAFLRHSQNPLAAHALRHLLQGKGDIRQRGSSSGT